MRSGAERGLGGRPHISNDDVDGGRARRGKSRRAIDCYSHMHEQVAVQDNVAGDASTC